jgi:hypothetical protein
MAQALKALVGDEHVLVDPSNPTPADGAQAYQEMVEEFRQTFPNFTIKVGASWKLLPLPSSGTATTLRLISSRTPSAVPRVFSLLVLIGTGLKRARVCSVVMTHDRPGGGSTKRINGWDGGVRACRSTCWWRRVAG